jgi:hypothetical protein
MREKILILTASFFCAACLFCSCYSQTRTSGDAADDAADDPLHDPVFDGGTDTADATDATDTLEDEDLPPQGPITFVIRNVTPGNWYVDWSASGYNLIDGARTTGGAWDPLSYWSPGCMMGCADSGPGTDCCVMCEPMMPAVKQLLPGEEVRMLWDGRTIQQVDDTHCTCSCYWERPPLPMGYRAEVCAYRDFNCYTSPCVPDADGVYWDAFVSGTPACFQAIFDIPYTGTEIVIEINL